MDYSNKLYYYRKQKSVSQDDLATSLGLCRKTISNIERGCQIPAITVAYSIADFFKVSVYDIFPNTEAKDK